jgi:hypothetical protein
VSMTERITLYCRCDERNRAHVAGEFLWSYTRNSWYFPDRLREMTWRARYYNDGTADHTHEPYEFFDCPFCGGVLPGCDDTQADGGR